MKKQPGLIKMFFAAACLAALCPIVGLSQTTRPALKWVGVWRQPAESFDTWKARGVDTMFGAVYGPDQTCKTAADYCAAAHSHGLKVIDADPAADGFEQLDEADGKGVDPSAIAERFAWWQESRPDHEAYLNLDGRRYQWTAASTYQAYAAGCTWIGFDRHVCNTGDYPAKLPLIGQQLDTFRHVAPAKNLFFIVECSDQNLHGDWADGLRAAKAVLRGPTPDEMETEIRLAIAHGVTGLVYFPDRIGTNFEAFDSMTLECVARMTKLNAELTAGAAVTTAIEATTSPAHAVTVDGVQYVPAK